MTTMQEAAVLLFKGEFNEDQIITALALEQPEYFAQLVSQYSAPAKTTYVAPFAGDSLNEEDLSQPIDKKVIMIRELRKRTDVDFQLARFSVDGVIKELHSFPTTIVYAIRLLRANISSLTLKEAKSFVNYVEQMLEHG